MTRLQVPRLAFLLSDRRGASVVEFAIVALPAIAIMCGLFDLGYRQYVAIQVQDALDRAARRVTVGPNTTSAQLTAMVKDSVSGIAKTATVIVVPTSYGKFQQVSKAEPITTDTVPLGTYNSGDCFTDINGNGIWDADAGRAGTGGSDDVVLYTATVTYPEIVPMSKLMGWSAVTKLTATTMLKNQPYASQAEPVTICN
ncbi:pilus assembly protein [Sphingomonas sanguinis]|uniref:TadE/TadG family type IV pilus assembly protein n=1 Tax=Sphingomonas sp. LC-1 TaxID=3110957 RepID=UPI0021BB338D|nr:TadE/TadG family type IV pilus assembly protein [Sphingomonas sp. LC-1]MCT8002014.1 pilus assembly protein [Sphingomonas sp. LC-1]